MIRVWAGEGRFGIELAEATLDRDWLTAKGVAIGSYPVPYRLDYELTTAQGFVTARLRVQARGDGWRREIDLRRADSGDWSCTAETKGNLALPTPGSDLSLVRGALDCDLAYSPL